MSLQFKQAVCQLCFVVSSSAAFLDVDIYYLRNIFIFLLDP